MHSYAFTFSPSSSPEPSRPGSAFSPVERYARAVGSPERAASIESTLNLARRNGATIVEKLEECATALEEEIKDLEQRLWQLRTAKAKAAWGDEPIRSPKRDKEAEEKEKKLQRRRDRWMAAPEVW